MQQEELFEEEEEFEEEPEEWYDDSQIIEKQERIGPRSSVIQGIS